MEKGKLLYLITTKGCESCNIMENILEEVVEEVPKTLLKIVDKDEVDTWIEINVIFKDFPTVVIIEENRIKYHFSGTKTKNEVKKLLDIKY